jgi:hypothetical protein
MKRILFGTLMLAAINSYAKVECTTEPKSSWKNADAFKKELEVTYKIKVFKVTEGNCFEIYGWDKAGKKVEIYFNPVTGQKVKERVQ